MKKIEGESALHRISGIRAALGTSPDGSMRPLWTHADGPDPDVAIAAQLRGAALDIPGASVLAARTAGRTALVGCAAGLFFEGTASVNLGLAMRAIPVEDAPLPQAVTFDPVFASPLRRMMWHLIRLFGRIETPRTFRFRTKADDVVIAAGRDGLRIVEGAPDVAGFVGAIRAACGRAKPIQYALSEAVSVEGPSEGPSALLVEAVSSDTLRLDAEGWPVALPPHIDFARLAAAIRLASALAAWGQAGGDRASWMQVRGSSLGPLAEGRADDSGWSIRWADPEPDMRSGTRA